MQQAAEISPQALSYAASLGDILSKAARDQAAAVASDAAAYDWTPAKIRHKNWIMRRYSPDGGIAPADPVFFRGGALTDAGKALVRAIKNADIHALSPDDYPIADIEAKLLRAEKMQKTLQSADRFALAPEELGAFAAWFDAHRAESDAARTDILRDGAKTPVPRTAAFYEREIERYAENSAIAEDIEKELADAWFTYAENLKFGNLMKFSEEELKTYAAEDNPNEIHPKYFDAIIANRVTEATDALAAPGANPGDVFKSLVPSHEQYAKLQTVRQRYREIADRGGWPTIAPDRMFAGGRAPLVRALRQRLNAEGYDAGDPESDLFDEQLTAAVRSYQKYHQLSETGEPDGVFWRSLNVSAAQRLAEIEANIRRWHRSIFEPRETYIYINLPSFSVEVWQNGKRIAEHRAVVGNSTKICNARTSAWELINATKIMHAKLSYVVFNPYWNVPPRIEVDEYQKKMAEDPKWLENSDFEYYVPRGGGRVLRQKPGERNALGRVKLIFPNRYNIYLHDTPKQEMFSYAVRAFSHGCIRVERAMEFAKTILSLSNQWNEAQIERYFKEAGEHPVDLNSPVDVFIDYHTVAVGDDGRPYFLADIYRYIRDEISPPTEAQRRCDPATDKTSSFRSGAQSDSGP